MNELIMHVQLSASEAGKEQLIKKCIAVLSDACNYVAESDKRTKALEDMQDVCDAESFRLKQLCATSASDCDLYQASHFKPFHSPLR